MSKPWAEVAASPEFAKLNAAQQEAARQQYFAEVVAPNVPESEVESVRVAFDADTRPKGRSTGEALVRAVGRTVRAGVKGVAAIPNMIGDAAGLDSTRATDALLDKVGLPRPENATERVAEDVASSMAGQGAIARGAGYLLNKGGATMRSIADLLRTAPTTQVVSAGGGAAGSSVAREQGAGPATQLVAGVGGSVAAPATMNTLYSAGRGALYDVWQPFTRGGQERIVGNTMNRLSADPRGAVQNLRENADEIVDGSLPTTAQASGDRGLAATERGLKATDPQIAGRFDRRASQANTARTILLEDMAGDTAKLEAARADRSAKAGALYERARTEGIDPEMSEVLKPQIKNLQQRMPKGVLEKAKELARLNGEVFDGGGSVQGLHWLKMAVDDAIDSARKTGTGAQTQRALVQFKDDLLTVFDDLSPSYGQARSKYAEMSKPIEQMEILQGIVSQVRNAGIDEAGNQIISQAKWSRVVKNREEELAKVLSPDQMSRLRSITADLDRGIVSETGGRVTGSDTIQKLSTANLIGSMLGGRVDMSNRLVANLARPLNWIYKLPDEQITQLLTDAMLDPKIGLQLMAKASTQNTETIGKLLLDKARAMGLGMAQSSAQAVQPE